MAQKAREDLFSLYLCCVFLDSPHAYCYLWLQSLLEINLPFDIFYIHVSMVDFTINRTAD